MKATLRKASVELAARIAAFLEEDSQKNYNALCFEAQMFKDTVNCNVRPRHVDNLQVEGAECSDTEAKVAA